MLLFNLKTEIFYIFETEINYLLNPSTTMPFLRTRTTMGGGWMPPTKEKR